MLQANLSNEGLSVNSFPFPDLNETSKITLKTLQYLHERFTQHHHGNRGNQCLFPQDDEDRSSSDESSDSDSD